MDRNEAAQYEHNEVDEWDENFQEWREQRTAIEQNDGFAKRICAQLKLLLKISSFENAEMPEPK